ncbi:unnamed protein product [Schistocephalus solidus]|uniref:Uncharacterized protein n=1 Tax=Schistocephalus solidus TaxID=70667 RepID=A0A183SU91_SCHSO|nr:unnamed protein product [Schistocephalus solidus]
MKGAGDQDIQTKLRYPHTNPHLRITSYENISNKYHLPILVFFLAEDKLVNEFRGSFKVIVSTGVHAITFIFFKFSTHLAFLFLLCNPATPLFRLYSSLFTSAVAATPSFISMTTLTPNNATVINSKIRDWD